MTGNTCPSDDAGPKEGIAATTALAGSGAILTISFSPESPTSEWFAVQLGISSSDGRPLPNFQNSGRMSRTDIVRLAAYLRKHIGPDSHHDITPSEEYVPQELDFKIRALSGEAWSIRDGAFWLGVLLNYRCAGEDSVYAGVEMYVETADALDWCTKLDETVQCLRAE